MTSGLEDIVAADSAVTWVDGKAGELRYRGYSIAELAGLPFECVAYLLWNGELPSPEEERRLKNELVRARLAANDMLVRLRDVRAGAHPLDVLRYLVSAAALEDPRVWDNDARANHEKAVAFTAWFPVATAAYHRLCQGLEPVTTGYESSTVESFLVMLHDRKPTDLEIQTLNTSFVLHADHELNASTFAARVTIATQSNLHAAMVSALGTLAGPRHGGASDRIIHMLEEIGSPEATEPWALEQLSRKQRIMGFGHRVYRTVDPRSRHLRVMAERLLAGTPQEPWIAILSTLTEVMANERGLYPNVDLWAAIVNRSLGISPAFYTSIFACSRIVGWTAHAVEQLDGRMIRPVANYVGPDPRSLVAVSVRS